MLDGVTNTDYFFDKAIMIPSEDAIEEFKLMNGMYSAEYGMASAQVNVAIKSGTNQLHGSAYDFLRNEFSIHKSSHYGAQPAKPYEPADQNPIQAKPVRVHAGRTPPAAQCTTAETKPSGLPATKAGGGGKVRRPPA